jgi:ketosteroid isomerase-like protein
MSEQQNTRVVQDAYAAFKRGDIQSVINACANDVEWISPGQGILPTGGTYRGQAEVGRFFGLVGQNLDFTAFEPRTYVAQGDTVVGLGSYRAKVKETGKFAEAEFAMVFTIRDGKITRFQEYTDTAAIAPAYGKAQAAA